MQQDRRLNNRVIVKREPEPDGIGERAELACGHIVIAVAGSVGEDFPCSECIMNYVRDPVASRKAGLPMGIVPTAERQIESKVLEVRDEGTCIPVLAIRMAAANDVQKYYFWRAGYPQDGSSIMVMRLCDGKATNDPYEWGGLTGDNRTLPVAHDWIIKHYAELADGDVVDVQVIIGQTETPKVSERLTVSA